MADDNKRNMPQQRFPLHLRLYVTGLVVLVAGLISATLVCLSTANDSGLGDALAGGKQYDFQLERIGGHAAVLAVQFNQWLGSFWHGRPLAYTLAVLSVGIAIVCFLLADRVSGRLRTSRRDA